MFIIGREAVLHLVVECFRKSEGTLFPLQLVAQDIISGGLEKNPQIFHTTYSFLSDMLDTIEYAVF